MNEVTISDIGHAVITLDLELDKLATEEQELEMKLEHCRARQAVISKAIMRLLDSNVYSLYGA
jgi:ribonuclease PH